MTIASDLMERRKAVLAEAEEIARRGVNFGRDLSANEQTRFDELIAEAEKIKARAAEIESGEHRADDFNESFRKATGGNPHDAVSGQYAQPVYGVSQANLRSLWDAMTQGTTAAVREQLPEQRAMVTSGVFGAPASWGSVAASPAQSLRQFAGIPTRPLEGMSATHPSVTLPAGAAGVGESAANTEITGAALSTLTTARYGGYTQVGAAVRTFDDLVALSAAQSVHIARSLNLADIAAIDAQAGTATVFASGTFDKDLRTSILTVAAAAGVAPSDVVAYGQPAALALVANWAPTDADGKGSYMTEVYGARVYSTLQAAVNKVTVFVPGAFVCFQTGIAAANLIDPTDGSMKFGQWLHSTPSGPAIVGAAKANATA